MKPRILLLTASTGFGHISASKALENEAISRGFPVMNVDCMNVVTPAFRGWFQGGYERLVRRAPWLWGHLYRTADRPRVSFTFQTALDWRFMDTLEPIIKDFRPDWVVCTHSLPQPRLSTLRPKFGFRMAVVITDLYPQRMWLRGDPDLYCVPTEWSLSALRSRVGPGPRVEITGIPIASRFRPPSSGSETAIPKLLMTVGGIAGGPLADAVEILSHLPLDASVDVLCGANRTAFEQIQKLPTGGRVKINPFEKISNDEVAAKMAAATLILGKSGGLTVSEALAVGLPFVVLDPFLIPGQEEQNAEFLVEAGIGCRVRALDDLGATVQKLLENPEKLRSMRKRALENAKPEAAATVMQLVEQLFDQNNNA